MLVVSPNTRTVFHYLIKKGVIFRSRGETELVIVTLAINYGAKKNGLFNGETRRIPKKKRFYPRDVYVYKLNDLFLETYYVRSRKGRKMGLNASLFIHDVYKSSSL